MEFPGDGSREHFLRSAPLRRDAYAKLPDGVEKGSIDRMLLKPLCGLSTACEDGYKTIRDFLANGRGGEVTSLDKSVFSGLNRGFGYGYGGKFCDPNSPNLDKGILKVGGNFETRDKRKALGIIAIRVDDLLISGSAVFIEYISKRMKGKFEADSYGGGGGGGGG